jgi:hypothetical protein
MDQAIKKIATIEFLPPGNFDQIWPIEILGLLQAGHGPNQSAD